MHLTGRLQSPPLATLPDVEPLVIGSWRARRRFPMFAVKQATLLDILERTKSSSHRCNVVSAIWDVTARCTHEETENHTLAGGVRSCQEGWTRAAAHRHMKRLTRPEEDEQATCTSLIA